MEFRVLGPFEVLDRDAPVALGAAKERALLAQLLIARGAPVPTDRLIDGLWQGRSPATAVKSVHVYVSHLRKALGDERLVTQAGGYALRLDARELDAARFEERLSEGQRLLEEGDAAAAAKVLRAGLSLWRGPPLTDFVYDDFAQREIARLEELRLSALEARAEADLALGRHAELVPELEALVAEHPTRERLRGRLMLALYRSGRQADALERFRSGRRHLQAELGIEPGPELRALHDAMLRQDPELDGPAPRRAVRARAGGRPWRLAAAGLVVIAGAVGAAVALHGGGGDTQVVLDGDAVGIADPRTGSVSPALSVPGTPDALAAADGRVWAVADVARTLTSFDASSRRVRSSVAPGGEPSDVAAAAGRVRTIDQRRHRLVEIDPAYNQVAGRPVRLPRAPALGVPNPGPPPGPWRIAATADAVWATNGLDRLIRVDVASGRVRTIATGRPLTGVAAAGGAIWALSGPSASVLRVAQRTGRVTDTIALGRSRGGSPWPRAAAGAGGSLWVLNANTSDLTEIDMAQARAVRTVPLGVEHQPVQVAAGGAAVWVADADGTLARVDPATGDPRYTVVAHALNDVAIAGGRVWLSAGADAYGPSLPPDARAASARPSPGIAPVALPRCSPLMYRPGDRPRLLLVSDLPLQTAEFGIQGNTAIELALRDRGFRAGRFPVAYQACADPLATTFAAADALCPANARAYARDASVVGVIAHTGSGCVRNLLPTLNRAPGGPLAAISSVTTAAGLTRAGPGAAPGEPRTYAPTGTPSFVRLTAPDNVQGAADAVLARRSGARRVYALDDGTPYGLGLSAAFRAAAARLGLDVVGRATWSTDDDRGHDGRIAARVRGSRAGAVFLAGGPDYGGVAMLQALRRVRPAGVQNLASDGFRSPATIDAGRRAADGLLISSSGLPNEKLPVAGRRFAAQLRAVAGAGADGFGTVGAAESVDVLLDAIGRSDGTRRSVRRELFATRVRDGLLGTFAIAPNGDTTMRTISIYRVTAGAMRYAQTIAPPPRLTGG